jgi:hypothetical protein
MKANEKLIIERINNDEANFDIRLMKPMTWKSLFVKSSIFLGGGIICIWFCLFLLLVDFGLGAIIGGILFAMAGSYTIKQKIYIK